MKLLERIEIEKESVSNLTRKKEGLLSKKQQIGKGEFV